MVQKAKVVQSAKTVHRVKIVPKCQNGAIFRNGEKCENGENSRRVAVMDEFLHPNECYLVVNNDNGKGPRAQPPSKGGDSS